MHSSLVEKPMLASGAEYAIDCWVFIVPAQLLYDYQTITTSYISTSHCVAAVASKNSFTPQIESKVVGLWVVWEIVEILYEACWQLGSSTTTRSCKGCNRRASDPENGPNEEITMRCELRTALQETSLPKTLHTAHLFELALTHSRLHSKERLVKVIRSSLPSLL